MPAKKRRYTPRQLSGLKLRHAGLKLRHAKNCANLQQPDRAPDKAEVQEAQGDPTGAKPH